MGSEAQTERLLTIDELSELTGLSKRWIRQAQQAGRIPHIRYGHRTIRYRLSEIQAWIEAHRDGPHPRRFQQEEAA